jgi:hypothetical protein
MSAINVTSDETALQINSWNVKPNEILSDAWEALTILDVNTNEPLAVITHGEPAITIIGARVLVKLTPKKEGAPNEHH